MHWICTVALRAQSAAAQTHTNTDNTVSTDNINSGRQTHLCYIQCFCVWCFISPLQHVCWSTLPLEHQHEIHSNTNKVNYDSFSYEYLIQVKLSSSWEEQFRNLWQHRSVRSTGWAGTWFWLDLTGAIFRYGIWFCYKSMVCMCFVYVCVFTAYIDLWSLVKFEDISFHIQNLCTILTETQTNYVA